MAGDGDGGRADTGGGHGRRILERVVGCVGAGDVDAGDGDGLVGPYAGGIEARIGVIQQDGIAANMMVPRAAGTKAIL